MQIKFSCSKKYKLITALAVNIIVSGCGNFYGNDNNLLANGEKVPANMLVRNHEEESKINAIEQLAWWQQFNSSQLNSLVKSSLKNNNDLLIARKNIEIAASELRDAELSWIPGVNLYAGFSQNPAFGNPGVFYGVQPSYITNLFSVYFNQKYAKYNWQQEKIVKLGVKLAVVSEISATYFALLAQKEQLNILSDEKLQYNKLFDIELKAQKIGISNSINLTYVRSKLDQISGKLMLVSKDIVASGDTICYLLNQTPGEVTPTTKFDQLPLVTNDFQRISIKTIANRPDVMLALNQLNASGVSVDLATSNLLPSLNFGYFTGNISSNGSFGNPNNPASFADAYAKVNIQASVISQIDTNSEKQQQSAINYNKIVKNALREIADSIDANSKLLSKYKLDRSALEAQVSRYNLFEDKFKQGLVNQIDLVNQKLMLDDLALNLNSSHFEYIVSLIKVYQQLAAGDSVE